MPDLSLKLRIFLSGSCARKSNLSISLDHFATPFQKYSVTPNAIHFAYPLTPSYFAEATGFVKGHAGDVFGEDARLQRPNGIPFRAHYQRFQQYFAHSLAARVVAYVHTDFPYSGVN